MKFKITKNNQKLGIATVKNGKTQLIAIYNPLVEHNPIKNHKRELFNCIKYLIEEQSAVSCNSISGFTVLKER